MRQGSVSVHNKKHSMHECILHMRNLAPPGNVAEMFNVAL